MVNIPLSDRAALRLVGWHKEDAGFIDKRSAYEESIRVPMIVSAPGRFPANTTVSAQVANLDIAPTILDLAGADIPEQFEGRSFRGATSVGNGCRVEPFVWYLRKSLITACSECALMADGCSTLWSFPPFWYKPFGWRAASHTAFLARRSEAPSRKGEILPGHKRITHSPLGFRRAVPC